MVKTFYKIVDGKVFTGAGNVVLDGFIEYKEGNEPKELSDLILSERQKYERDEKIRLSLRLLDDTQWVESYILRHEQGIISIPYDSNKWNLHAQRLDAIAFLKENGE